MSGNNESRAWLVSVSKTERETRCPTPETHGPALMREKLAEYGRMLAAREALVAEAKSAGLSEVEIAKLTGHSRNTIRGILGRDRVRE
ncbi:hypothetical protein ACIRLA_45210 [Streptomyces sp. NPDC102364]|uniref:hypothetical protein n=1 Tax=Streptomyces sp. NPDC102364 TaxID=3366161 RepID=UPI0037F6BC70